MSAIDRRVREAKLSITSRAATSMMTPRARCSPIWRTRSFWNRIISEFVEGSVDRRDEGVTLTQDGDEGRS